MNKLFTDSKFEFIANVDLCSTNKAKDFYIGRINNGIIIFGGDYFYDLFWNDSSEIRHNLINNFNSHEVIAVEYNDQVMTMGYLIIDKGSLRRIAEVGDGELDFGELTDIEISIRSKIANNDNIPETEVSNFAMVGDSLFELEKTYLNLNLDEIKCSDLPLEQYQQK